MKLFSPHSSLSLFMGERFAILYPLLFIISRILEPTPSIFCNTSLFQNLRTRKPFLSSHFVRVSSFSISDCWLCCPPSSSIISSLSKLTKSTIYFPIGSCRRNLLFSNCLPRNIDQSFLSASVCLRRRFLARVVLLEFTINFIPLTRGLSPVVTPGLKSRFTGREVWISPTLVLFPEHSFSLHRHEGKHKDGGTLPSIFKNINTPY